MAIIVEPPPGEEAMAAPPTTAPRRRRQWWRWRFPWVKTAVAAPFDDEVLLIVNTTDRPWIVSLGYRNLGLYQPYERHYAHVVRSGLLTARQPDASAGDGYLTLSISPAVYAVEIRCDVVAGERSYGLWVREEPRPGRAPAPVNKPGLARRFRLRT